LARSPSIEKQCCAEFIDISFARVFFSSKAATPLQQLEETAGIESEEALLHLARALNAIVVLRDALANRAASAVQ
jgi:hypothetical protein